METKTFDLGTVLSVTTGRLLTPTDEKHTGNGIGHLYELLGWMTEDEPFTHQLPRFAEECKPCLLRWFPELAKADDSLRELDNWLAVGGDPGRVILNWLSTLRLPMTYDVPRIPRDDHTRKNALTELVEMVGSEKVIPLVIPDEPNPSTEPVK
jgi:hypothetical protein